MFVNEYMPACGWIKHNKRKALLGKLKAAGIVLGLLAGIGLGLLAAYGLAGYIEMGM